jgi:hypothetical protein
VHSIAIIPGFGHLDVLFGTRAPELSYPEILSGLGPARTQGFLPETDSVTDAAVEVVAAAESEG